MNAIQVTWLQANPHDENIILRFLRTFDISHASAVENCLAHRLYHSSNADKNRVLNGAHGSVGHYPTAFGSFGVGIWLSKDDRNLNPQLKDLVASRKQQAVYADFPTLKDALICHHCLGPSCHPAGDAQKKVTASALATIGEAGAQVVG